LEFYEKHDSSDQISIFIALNNVGYIFYCLKKYDEVRKHDEQALLIQEKEYESGHVDIIHSLMQIGNILSE